MHYIIVDLEWNQPMSFNSKSYKEIEDKLLFEIIEIGAVKLDENFNIVDKFRRTVKPTYFIKLHPRIKKLTGISPEILDSSDDFNTVYKEFLNFCGDDAIFITWGSEDVSVYKQNIECFDFDYEDPKFYNLQTMFHVIYKTEQKQASLKSAMEILKIEDKDELPFHDALNDALYTAQVFKNIDRKKEIYKYEQKPKKLAHQNKMREIRVNHQVLSVKHALNSSIIQSIECPCCKQKCKIINGIVNESPISYIFITQCPTHGSIFVQARFGKLKNRNVGMKLSILPITKEHKQYIKTKILQNSLHPGLNQAAKELPDFTYYGSMPFEEV